MAAALALSALCAPAAFAGGPCPHCKATWSGTWTASLSLRNAPPNDTTFATEKLQLTWTATLTWANGSVNEWKLDRANGTFSVTGSTPGSPAGDNCSAQLSPGPDAIVHGEAFWAATSDGISPSAQRGFGKYWTVEVQPPAQWGQTFGANPLRQTGAANGTNCAGQGNFALNGAWHNDLGGSDCWFDKSDGQNWVAFPIGAQFTDKESCTGSGNDQADTSWSATLEGSLTFASPGKGPGGGPIHAGGQPAGFGPSLSDIKDLAREDFKEALKDALGACLGVGAGLGVVATGAVWGGTSALVPGGLPSAGAIIATGEVMTNAAAPLCVQKLGRLLDDFKVIDDPPDGRVWQLATVARAGAAPDVSGGCKHAPRKARAFCQQLAGLVKKLIRAAGHTKAVDDALVTTVNRASGAKRAHNQTALRRQLNHAKSLESQLRAALRGEASIGRQIRKLLPFGKLTASQAAKATGYLERHGATVTRLRRVDPAALHPSGLDPIARLVNP